MEFNAKAERYKINVKANLKGAILLVAFTTFIAKIWESTSNAKIQFLTEKISYKEVVKCY